MLGAAAIPVNVAKEPADVAKEPMDGFSLLKTVLDAISAGYTDYKVRLHRPAQDNSLTNPPTGNHRHQKQD